jgi:gas vesicle protein
MPALVGLEHCRGIFFRMTAVVVLLMIPAMAMAQQGQGSGAGGASKTTSRKTDTAVKPVVAVDPAANATKIAELRSQIDSEEKQLDGLKKQLESQALPESKFSKAEARFKMLDGKLKELKSKLADLQSREQPDAEQVAEVQGELHDTEEARNSALKGCRRRS